MTQVTRLVRRVEEGDAAAAEDLLPLAYRELRELAGCRMANAFEIEFE